MNQVIQIICRLTILIIWVTAVYLIYHDLRSFNFDSEGYSTLHHSSPSYWLTVIAGAIVSTYAMKWVFSTKEPKQAE